MPRVNSAAHPPAEPTPPEDADPVLNERPDDPCGRETGMEPDGNDVDDVGELYGVAEPEGVPIKLGADLIGPRDRERWENNPDSKDEAE